MMWNNACPFLNGASLGTWGWVGMALYMLFWVGLIVGLVYLVVWLVRRSSANLPVPGGAAGALSAREIAQARYARGEINREEYLNILADLK